MSSSRTFDFSTRSIASFSARHAWWVVGIWVALVAFAIFIQTAYLSDALTTEFDYSHEPESTLGAKLLETKLRGPRSINEVVIIKSETLNIDDQIFRAQVDSIYAYLLGQGDSIISGATNYYLNADPSLVAPSRDATLVPFQMAGEFKEATVNIEPIIEFIADANEEPGFTVYIVGEASSAFENNELSEKEIQQGEIFGIPTALLILLALFGAVVAAVVPLILAAISIVIALAATAIVGQIIPLVFFVTLMITMIGLAVGIDYALIVVSRFREELAKGRSKSRAIEITGSTANRTVFFSGMTVVLALLGMLIIPTNIFQSLGIGAILVVICAVCATLTLLPAVLSILGDKINFMRLPLVGRNLNKTNEGGDKRGFWDRTTQLVMRHPIISLFLAGGLMLGSAAPVVDLNTGFNGLDSLPKDLQVRQAFDLIEREFPGGFGSVAPVDIVIEGDLSDKSIANAIQDFMETISLNSIFAGTPSVQTNSDQDLAVITTFFAGAPASDPAVKIIDLLRNDYIPNSFGNVDANVYVTGQSAFNKDFFNTVDTYTIWVFAFVLGLSFLLLTVAFRSIVIPIKSIFLNLLSVGAAYGLLVLIFIHGYGADLLGFETSPSIEAWIPLFLFSVLFGLSMDYHVFLISRIRERFDLTNDNAESVAYGLRSTAGLITGAALIMVAVFSGFASGDLIGNQQVGFGLAIAIFLDATIVRSILVPSTMKLLGKWNWYLPPWLEWLPKVSVENSEIATEAKVN